MMKSSTEISKDHNRDRITVLGDIIAELLEKEASVTKRMFTYIFEDIFLSIDPVSDYLDITGEMYSRFLRYALGGGKELGIVLAPSYVARMMFQILDIGENSKAVGLATGPAGFLIPVVKFMIECAE